MSVISSINQSPFSCCSLFLGSMGPDDCSSSSNYDCTATSRKRKGPKKNSSSPCGNFQEVYITSLFASHWAELNYKAISICKRDKNVVYMPGDTCLTENHCLLFEGRRAEWVLGANQFALTCPCTEFLYWLSLSLALCIRGTSFSS